MSLTQDNRPAAASFGAVPLPVPLAALAPISDEDWDRYLREGFLHLGPVLSAEQIQVLQQRADDLALGVVDNEHIQLQRDTGGAYEDLPDVVSAFEEGTHLYRKIQGLEADPLFLPLVQHPRFLEVCAQVYGRHAALTIFRAMIMNKPAGQGTVLPWHQDGGDVWALDRDPLVTIWVALDPATKANGCMEAVVGSHRLGLLSTTRSVVSDADVERHCNPELIRALEVEPGHAILLHNWLIHRSGVNPSPVPRRAVTICYMDGRTRGLLTGDHYPLVAGTLDPEPPPYVRQLTGDVQTLRTMFGEAESYAKSLEAELLAVRADREQAQSYARSLEVERDRLEQASAGGNGAVAPEAADPPAPPAIAGGRAAVRVLVHVAARRARELAAKARRPS